MLGEGTTWEALVTGSLLIFPIAHDFPLLSRLARSIELASKPQFPTQS